MQDNVDRKTKSIVGNITGDVVHPLARLLTEKNGCKHRILPYVGTYEKVQGVKTIK